jgi:hypothetical protein
MSGGRRHQCCGDLAVKPGSCTAAECAVSDCGLLMRDDAEAELLLYRYLQGAGAAQARAVNTQ